MEPYTEEQLRNAPPRIIAGLIYKCRLCGVTYVERDLQDLSDAKVGPPLAYKSPNGVHDCGSGRMGLSDLQGRFEKSIYPDASPP